MPEAHYAVLDPFAGTGTTLRVAKRCGFNSDLIELDWYYCTRIAEEHGMEILKTKAADVGCRVCHATIHHYLGAILAAPP